MYVLLIAKTVDQSFYGFIVLLFLCIVLLGISIDISANIKDISKICHSFNFFLNFDICSVFLKQSFFNMSCFSSCTGHAKS